MPPIPYPQEFDDERKPKEERVYLEDATTPDDEDLGQETAPRLSMPAAQDDYAHLMEIENLNYIPEQKLKLWNMAAVVFQFAQAGIFFYLSTKADTNWYLYTNYPITLDDRGIEIDDEGQDAFGRPNSAEFASYTITWYSAVFILLSGLYHSFVLVFWDRYKYYLERHQNPYRWAEYSVSASLQRVAIAQVTGVTDVHLLLMIFVGTAVTMLLGGVHESVNAKSRADGYPKQNWYPYVAAWLPHMATWLVIFTYFFKSVINGDPPVFVWATVFILFILDGTFALLFHLQWSNPEEDYITGEIAFIVLSFTSKFLLAWINYGGASQ